MPFEMPDHVCGICGQQVPGGQYHDCDKPKHTPKLRWTVGVHGFGFGVWRNVMPYQTIWTVCIGPASIYLSRA